MAEPKSKKKRIVKKTETVRQQRERAATAIPKQRKVRTAATKANGRFKVVSRMFGKLFRPLSFLLWPFKTRPVRFVGRILSKVLLIDYIRASWKELRLVEWPDRVTTFKLSLAVFIFAFAFGSLIAILDFILDKIFKQILT